MKEARHNRPQIVWLYEKFRIGKSIHIKSINRLVVARGFFDEENILKLDSFDGSTAMWIYFKKYNCKF